MLPDGMTGDDQTRQVLERQACGDPRCLCALSLRKQRGPSHCPICLEQPNLALRVRGADVSCKAGCDQDHLLVALGLICHQLATDMHPVADAQIDAVTHRPYRRRSCAWCGKRLEPGRRDRVVCGDACRQRRHRAASA
jgi:hypothetical protein